MSIEWFICRRYLTTKGSNSLTYFINVLAVTGIAIGVMVLIITVATTNGFQTELEKKILSVDPHIVVFKHDCFFPDNQDKRLDDLAKIKYVTSVNVAIHLGGVLRSAHSVSGTLIKGIDFLNDSIPSCAIITNNKSDETFPPKKSSSKEGLFSIMLGIDLANQLNVGCGEVIYLVTPISNNNLPMFIPTKVIALLETGIKEYDSILAYVDISEISTFLDAKKLTSSIEIRVSDAYNSAKVAKIIKDKVGPEFLVRDWAEINSTLFSLLKIQKYVIFIILSLVILVAAVSVASTLVMMALNKNRDIVILKSMGVPNLSIGKIFIFRGVFIGFMGMIYGTSLGFFICYLLNRYEFVSLPENVYPLSKLPVIINYQEIAIVLFFTTIVCLLSSIYPAYKACSLTPSKIIHFE